MQSNPPSVTLTGDEARALTAQVNGAPSEQLWGLLLVAFERRAWESLGYSSWRDYALADFDTHRAAGMLALRLHDGYKPGRIVWRH